MMTCTSCTNKSNGNVADAAQPIESHRENPEEADANLGEMQMERFEGILPGDSGTNVRYQLLIRHRLHSGDGTFQLTLTRKNKQQDNVITYTGKRWTLRGAPNDKDATVWQCTTEDGKDIFNFLYENEDSLILLNKFETPPDPDAHRLTRTKDKQSRHI